MAEIVVKLVPNNDGELVYHSGDTIKGILTMTLTKETRCKEAVLMSCGRYNYKFSFELPYSLPRSTTGFYCVEGNLDIPWRFMKRTETYFILKRSDNLNIFPILRVPSVRKLEKNFFNYDFICGPEENLRMTAFIPQTGYVPGQMIKIKLRYDNLSSVKIDSTTVQLIETKVERYEEEDLTKRKSKKLAKVEAEGVKERDVKEIEAYLKIPFDTRESDFLFSRASLKIIANTKGMHLNPKVIIPIVIETVPLVEIPADQQTILGIDHPLLRVHLAKEKI